MKHIIKSLAIFLVFATTLATYGQTQIKQDAPQKYLVQKGDTLWDISAKFLDSPWQWPKLWQHNSDVENPHLIYPGDVIVLRFNELGEPVLEVVATPKKQVKLTPESRRIQKQAISTIDLSSVASVLDANVLLSNDELAELPQVLGNTSGSMLTTKNHMAITEAKGLSGQMWVIRPLFEITDMEGEVIGMQLQKIAKVEVGASGKNVSLLNPTELRGEIKQGDYLWRDDDAALVTQFELVSANEQAVGHVIATANGQRMVVRRDLVIIDLGEDQQIVPGTVFGIYKIGPDILIADKPKYAADANAWEKLMGMTVKRKLDQPAILMGRVVVVRTFDSHSYGLIMSANEPVKAGMIIGPPQ